uniref:hypothetical protein n=1 Tax=Aliarcobacter sp. TaxID=2321116 RepID=UPI0040486412
MKQIFTIIFFTLLFFGCTPKQTVELKVPQNNQKLIKNENKPISEDSITIIEEFSPIDIKESANLNNGELLNNELIEYDAKLDMNKIKIKVAFIYPSSLVSKYAKSSLNTISGYFSYQKANYDLIVIDSKSESYSDINIALKKAEDANITKIIALFTPNAINTLEELVSYDMKIYLPLIEKKDSLSNNSSLIFGSISYEEQFKKLNSYSNFNNAMFYQDTYLGNKLRISYDSLIFGTKVRKEIKKDETNFKNIVNDYRLNNSTLFLNTDIVKSSLILSQLTVYEINPKIIFSTQLNYDPMLMILTQDRDRKKLVIANSIDNVNKELRDEILTFGGNIIYEWVDYSTLVGINYLYNDDNTDLIPTKIIDNKAVYNPKLYKSTDVGFLEIK